MKVLVTGGTGQVAKSLVSVGATSGARVIAVGRPSLDITVPESILDAINTNCPDVIVNAAAYTAVDRAESEPKLAHLVNAVGAENVSRAAQEAGVPIIHISTDYVFDGDKEDAYIETDATNPVSVYGRTKLEGEAAVAAANPRHVILRTAWVHSPFGDNFVRTMLRLAETRHTIGVVDDQTGSPTYAPHLAEAILTVAGLLAERNADDICWGIYHATGTGETTWCGLAREVFTLSSSLGGPSAHVNQIATSAYPTPARRPANSRLVGDKLRRTFGVALPHWQDGAAACVSQLVCDVS